MGDGSIIRLLTDQAVRRAHLSDAPSISIHHQQLYYEPPEINRYFIALDRYSSSLNRLTLATGMFLLFLVEEVTTLSSH